MAETQYNARSIGKVKDLGEIFEVCAPLDKQIEAFVAVGITAPFVVLPQEVVDIRLAGVSDNFSRTSMAPLAVKSEKTILYKPSPWFSSPEMARVAVMAHANSRFPQMSRDFFEAVKERAKKQESSEPEDRTALILSRKGDFQLTPEMPDTKFIFGPRAVEYFKAKKHKSIPFYDLNSDSTEYTDVNYLWFFEPQNVSNLSCRYGILDFEGRVFGVLRAGEASAKNSGYCLSEIRTANYNAVTKVLQGKNLSGLQENLQKDLSDKLLEELRSRK